MLSRFFRSMARKFRVLFRRDRIEAEMNEEMRAHLELLAVENEKTGMSVGEARQAARREFGGVEQIKERARDQRGWMWLDHLARDTRHGWRVLVKAPLLSAVI